MLQIQLDGSWKYLDADVVVDDILHGRMHDSTPARNPARGFEPGPLETMLEIEHFRELSQRLLREVVAFYTGELDGLGLPLLEQRVAELTQWRLHPEGSRRIRLRLAWLAAWLAELAGKNDLAIKRYITFLRLRPDREEPGLCLLALNNHAVLLLQTGRISAVRHLARAAVIHQLPGACFSVLNVVSMAVANNNLAAVDRQIMRVLRPLSPDQLNLWLGPPREDSDEESHGTRTLAGDLPALNLFVCELARRAVGIRPCARHDDEDANIAEELQLWSPDPELLLAPHPLTTLSRSPASHAVYAEAVSLLYPRDVPDGLSGAAERMSTLEAWVEKRIAQAQTELEAHDSRAAEAMLRELDALLASRPQTRRAKVLRDRIGRLLHRTAKRRKELLTLEFQNTMANVDSDVTQLCQVSDPTEADTHHNYFPLVRAEFTVQ